jgi:antitoxin YefM
MSIETTYSEARANLAQLMDRVIDDSETIIITRRGHQRVAMIAADELESLLETDYLLRSPVNAERLLGAMQRSREGQGTPMTLDQLRRAIGLPADADSE